MKKAKPIKPPIEFRQTQNRRLMYLWIIAVAWLLSFLVISIGYIPWWLFGVVSIGCFGGAFVINNRIMGMIRHFENGRCWKCGYTLDGIEAKRCPECGAEC